MPKQSKQLPYERVPRFHIYTVLKPGQIPSEMGYIETTGGYFIEFWTRYDINQLWVRLLTKTKQFVSVWQSVTIDQNNDETWNAECPWCGSNCRVLLFGARTLRCLSCTIRPPTIRQRQQTISYKTKQRLQAGQLDEVANLLRSGRISSIQLRLALEFLNKAPRLYSVRLQDYKHDRVHRIHWRTYQQKGVRLLGGGVFSSDRMEWITLQPDAQNILRWHRADLDSGDTSSNQPIQLWSSATWQAKSYVGSVSTGW
jgi:hypothetical protein